MAVGLRLGHCPERRAGRLRGALQPILASGRLRQGCRVRCGGNALTSPSPTLETLLELGFEDRPPVIQVPPTMRWMVPQVHQFPIASVCYWFADFDLVASPTLNSFNVPVIGMTGYRGDDRSLSIIEGQIP